jgi:Lar family restriction alleviation protein
MREIELKNCPFCGGKADFNIKSHNQVADSVSAHCTECKAETGSFLVTSLGICIHDDTLQKVADLWNIRYDK